MNHWTEIVIKVGNIISANAVQHLELRIIGTNRKGTHRSNLEDTWRKDFFFFIFCKRENIYDKRNKIIEESCCELWAKAILLCW